MVEKIRIKPLKISVITDLDPDPTPDPQNENEENRYCSKMESLTDDSKTDLNL